MDNKFGIDSPLTLVMLVISFFILAANIVVSAAIFPFTISFYNFKDGHSPFPLFDFVLDLVADYPLFAFLVSDKMLLLIFRQI